MLTQGLEPRSSSQRAVSLLHHRFGLCFSRIRPILDLQHWVIGSGHNPDGLLLTSAPDLKQVFWKFEMGRERGAWRGVKAPSLGSDPLTPWPALTTPLSPDPWTPDPEELWPQSGVSLNVRWAWRERGLEPLRMRRGALMEDGVSEEEMKVVYVRSGCLDCLEWGGLCSVLVLRLIDHRKAACCYPFWSVKMFP